MKTYFENLVKEFKNMCFKDRKDQKNLGPRRTILISKYHKVYSRMDLVKDESPKTPDKQAGFYMKDSEWAKLKEITKKYKIGMKDLVLLVLTDFLDKYERADDFFNLYGI